MTFIGIDLGTSALKAVLVDDGQRILAAAHVALTTAQPRPLWSEQEPGDWPEATFAAFAQLQAAAPADFAACRGIGLSGHMHGAVLLDADDHPLRPCILWNDGRAGAECGEIERAVAGARAITGNIAMPGFTAPKLAWVRRHEPDVFASTRRVLLPKAYLRLVLTGEAIEEMSDASGTLWLDIGARDWSDAMLAATGLSRRHMPALVEGAAPAGRLRPELARRFGFDSPPLFAGGAGDNAAGAVGLGAVAAGDCFLSLGTSGVLWRTTAAAEPQPDSAVHAFCHALPGLWHQMSVHLSAAACLGWWAGICATPEAELLAPLGARVAGPASALFLPYLTGERTPHNDPAMRAGFLDLGAATTRKEMTQAVLEGVAFAFLDGKRAMEAGGQAIREVMAIGGGARSDLWLAILADVLDVTVHRVTGSDVAGALGAARLARLAVTGADPVAIATKPPVIASFRPDPDRTGAYRAAYGRWRQRVAASRTVDHSA